MNLRQIEHDENDVPKMTAEAVPKINDKPKKEVTETNVFRALQSNECDHNWISDGRDSHHDYFICTKCNLSTRT